MQSSRGIALALILFCVLLRTFTLQYPALSDPSEGRYATVAAQMADSGDWVTLQTYHEGKLVPFLGKPPLHAWLTAISYKLLGKSEVAARLPSLLAALVTALLAAIYARRFYGEDTGYLTAVYLFSAGGFFIFTGSCLTDPLLTTCITMCVVSFALSAEETDRKVWGHIFFLSVALGMLSKGPVAIAISGVPIFVWSVLKRSRAVFSLPWLTGMLLFFAVTAPWYILAEIRQPGFIKYFFLNENLYRFLYKDYGDRYGTPHTSHRGIAWLFMFAAFCPWSVWLPALSNKKYLVDKYRAATSPQLNYLVLWAAAAPLFFTLARQVSISYLMPSLPPLAVLAAILTKDLLDSEHREKVRKIFNWNFVFCGVLAVIATALGLFFRDGWVIFAVSAGLILLFYGAGRRATSPEHTVLKSIAAAALALTLVLLNVKSRIDPEASAKDLVQYIQSKNIPGARIGFVYKIPHSAYFYCALNGPACEVEPLSPEEAASTPFEFVAVPKKRAKELPEGVAKRFTSKEDIGFWEILF